MAVNISGTVLASLLYDQSRSTGDQTGFLIGDVVRHVTDTISDSQINNIEVENKVYIYETVPCPRDQRFFNPACHIRKEAIADLLKSAEGEKTIVGLYSFRRNSTLRPSYRERLLYENLGECVGMDRNLFTLLLCSARASTNKATHTLDYTFLHLVNSVFKRLPVSIANLGDTTHTEYKHMPSLTASKSQGISSHLVHKHEGNFLNQQGKMEVHQIQSLNNSFNRKLEEISSGVISSESRLAEVEGEVGRLRKQVRLKRLEQEQELRRLDKAESPNTSGSSLKDTEKRPSVDEILCMDQMDSSDSGPPLVPPAVGSVGLAQGDSSSDTCLDSVDSDSDAALQTGPSFSTSTPQIKLTLGATLHNRSSSVGNEKDIPVKAGITSIHTRSKSNELSGEPVKQSSDPFSFITSVVAESKAVKPDNSGKGTVSEDSDGSGYVKGPRVKRKVSAGAMAAAKSLGNSQSRGDRSKKSEGDKLRSQYNVADSDAMEVDSDVSDTRKSRSSQSPSVKTCSQEVDELEDTASSQDTYEMDVSSSPVY